jgi:hypothetical protein
MLEAPLGDPEPALREKLSTLIEGLLAHMLETGAVEPAWLQLVAGASASLAALDRRQQPKESERGE